METISLSWTAWIVQALGLSGVVFIIWWFDHKRFIRLDELREKEIAERQAAIALVLAQYKDDVLAIKRMYENNVSLVKDYQTTSGRLEGLFSEVLGVVSLNTQVQQQLTDSIRNNLFCPMVREKIAAKS
jgi:hypothetical protein